MGQHGGPLNKAISNLAFSIDASNLRSYSGSGNTSYDLITLASLTLSSVTYSSSGTLSYYIFSGSGNITSSSNVGISGASSRTISCWAYFTSKAIQSLMCIGVNGAGTGWGIETSSTVFNLSKGNSGTVTSVTYTTGQWYNIVYVGQNLSANSLTVSLYINGSLQYSGTDTPINTTDSTLKLGTNNAGTLAFNGRISQAKVYNKALSSDEIQKNYDGMKSKFGL
jgi:hypothetical protein